MAEYIITPDAIRKIAEDVFADRVEVTGNARDIKILVHFPQVQMSNSRGAQHTIYDVWARFSVGNINTYAHMNKCYLYFHGTRTSFTVAELVSCYVHSHLPNGTTGFDTFCLGASQYLEVHEHVKRTLSEDNWYGLFLGLERYLAWESLEGGPHTKIAGISTQTSAVTATEIQQNLAGFIQKFPVSSYDILPTGATLNRSAEFEDISNRNSRIRKSVTTGAGNVTSTIKNRLDNYSGIVTFKGQRIEPKIINGSGESSTIDSAVLDQYHRIANHELQKFFKTGNYEQLKQAATLIHRQNAAFQ